MSLINTQIKPFEATAFHAGNFVAVSDDNGIGHDAKELLRKVKAAQYVASHPGEVCPAKWQEGDKTLKPSLDLERLRALDAHERTGSLTRTIHLHESE